MSFLFWHQVVWITGGNLVHGPDYIPRSIVDIVTTIATLTDCATLFFTARHNECAIIFNFPLATFLVVQAIDATEFT